MFQSIYVEESYYYIKNILSGLKEKGYNFHNLDHTLEVFERTTYLGNKEKISFNEMELIQIAALFHDTGFIEDYDYHEYVSARLAEKFLKNIEYKGDIEKINEVILKTIPNSESNSNLSNIIKDADLDNLGRYDFFEKGQDLRRELKNIKGLEVTDLEWYSNTYKFIKNINFYSETQIKEKQQKLIENKKILYDYIRELNQ